MAYDIQVLSVEPIPIAAIRTTAAIAALDRRPAALRRGLEVREVERRPEARSPRRRLLRRRHHAGGRRRSSARPFAGDGRVISSATPGGTVATTAHIGPYGRLGEAHRAITDWCAANGRE